MEKEGRWVRGGLCGEGFVSARPVKSGRWGRLRAGRSGKSEGGNVGTGRTEKTLFGVTGGSGPSTAAASVGAPELEGEARSRAAQEGEGFRLPAGGVE